MDLKPILLISLACTVQGTLRGRQNYGGAGGLRGWQWQDMPLRNPPPYFSINNENFLPLALANRMIGSEWKTNENEIVQKKPIDERNDGTTEAVNNEELKTTTDAPKAPSESSSSLPIDGELKAQETGSAKFNVEVDFHVDMPDPSEGKTSKAPDTEKIEESTTTTKPKSVDVLGDSKLIKSILLDMLTSPNMMRQKPVTVKSKCNGVSCLKPPSEMTCHLQEMTVKISSPQNSKYEQLSNCCPLWLCTRPDGSFHTHFGMVGKLLENKEHVPALLEETIPQLSFSRSMSSPQEEVIPEKSKIQSFDLFLRNLFPKLSPFRSLSPDNELPLLGNRVGNALSDASSSGSPPDGEWSITSGPGFFSASIKTHKIQGGGGSDEWNQVMEKLKSSSGSQLVQKHQKKSSQVPIMLPFFIPRVF